MEVLILFASWEERCCLGFDADLENSLPNEVVVPYYEGYAEKTSDCRQYVETQCRDKGIKCEFVPINAGDIPNTWQKVVDRMREIDLSASVLLDVTTMPREIVWYCMWALDQPGRVVDYVYHSPEGYGSDWLSRSPMRPRLVYKLSGLSSPDRKTALLLTVGFDAQRVQRVVDWLEPTVLLVGIQSSSDFDRNDAAMDQYRADLEKSRGCSFFDLDVFSEDHGFASIVDALDSVVDDHNVMMTSLGPKISAVTLYQVKRKREKIGLIYTPAEEYNDEYSRGIGKTYHLTFPREADDV